jgi:hypothetical protein
MDPSVLTGLALVAVGILVGTGLLILSGRFQARIEQARQWNEVPAVIETARLANLGKGKFAPKFSYSYAVAGTGYVGRRLQFGGVAMTRDEAEAVMAAYPSGAPATVRYDPHRHDFAVLRVDADVKGYRMAGMLVGLSFVVAGLVVAVAG